MMVDDWDVNRKLVMQRLEDVRTAFERVELKIDEVRREDIAPLKIEIALMKVKVAMWASLLGFVSSALVYIGSAFISKLGH